MKSKTKKLKLKSHSASKTWNFQPVVTEINKKVQRDGQEICFWWKKSCFGGQQLPCPSSNSELKIDQVVFPPTKHKFSDVANGPCVICSLKAQYHNNV